MGTASHVEDGGQRGRVICALLLVEVRVAAQILLAAHLQLRGQPVPLRRGLQDMANHNKVGPDMLS